MSEESHARQIAQGHHIAQALGSGSRAIVADQYWEYTYKYTSPRPPDAATLAEAEQMLADLPLDEVPNPSPLPHGSVMPLSANPLFVGREENLNVLARTFKPDDKDSEGRVTTVAVAGIGGIGKSQVASEFVHRYGRYFFGGVFWLSFADAATVPAEVASCGGAGRLELRPDFSHLSVEDQVREVQSVWQSPLPRLLVFDNCEDERLLDQWRPPTGGCRVLVTTRRERWDTTLGVRILSLDTLNREQSVALLRKHRPDLSPEDPSLNAIADELGDLPLALELAGRYLGTYRHAVVPVTYLERLRSSDVLGDRSLREAKGVSPTRHAQDVARTFKLSYEQLDTDDDTDARAVALLARAGRFAPGEPIPRELLLSTVDLLDENPEAPELAEDSLARLTETGLLEEQAGGALRMHRLITAYVRGEVNVEGTEQMVEVALVKATGTLLDERNPRPLLPFLPHLRAVTDAAQGRNDGLAAPLCEHLGRALALIGAYDEARSYLEYEVNIYEKTLGEHPATAGALDSLAGVLGNQGRYQETRPLYERSLSIREKSLGEEHPDTAISLTNLGRVLYDQGNYDQAERMYKRALANLDAADRDEDLNTAALLGNLAMVLHVQDRYDEERSYLERSVALTAKALGEDNPATAMSLDQLASLLRAQGNYDEARRLQDRALAILEETLGEEHPETVTALYNLGNLLYQQGNYDGARPLYERSLAIREKTLGPEHPYTAQSLNALAYITFKQGDYDRARPLFDRAVDIYEATVGAEHPETAMVLSNLVLLLVAQDNYDEARPLQERVVSIYEETLDPEHPETLKNMNRLAYVMYKQADYEGARLLFERALTISEKAFGPEHPSSIEALHNLAHLLGEAGDYEKARPLQERLVDLREKVLGPDSPDTASALTDLASMLLQAEGDNGETQGRYDEAQPLYERALAIYEATVGEDHPSTALTLSSLGHVLKGRFDYNGAQRMYERVLAIREKTLGPDHPLTARSLVDLASTEDIVSFEEPRGSSTGAGAGEPDYSAFSKQSEEGRRLRERAVTIYEKALGEGHPQTAIELAKIGDILLDQRDEPSAEVFYERAVSILEATVGDHTATAAILSNLSNILALQNDDVGAQRVFERALSIYEKAVGSEHPETATALIVRASMLRALGRYEEARPMYERALSIREKALGPEHPDTMSVRQDLIELDADQES